MRKLKLQVQLSLDGFVGRLDGGLDWMTWNWDDELKEFVNDLHDSVNTILLGRKMTDGFVSHWTSVVDKHDESTNELRENYAFAKRMVDIPKVVFSKTINKSQWSNTTVTNGDIADEVNNLKNQKSRKDIIVYGGASFVSSLIKNNLIDEYYLFVNPTAIGEGMPIFKEANGKINLNLVHSSSFNCGIVVNQYKPASI